MRKKKRVRHAILQFSSVKQVALPRIAISHALFFLNFLGGVMKISSYATLASFALAVICFQLVVCAGAVAQSSPIKVSIDTKNGQHTFKPGEQIILIITVENISDSAAALPQTCAALDCDTLDNEISLTDASGDSPPMTALGKKITSVSSLGPRRALRLQPGASKQINLDVSQLYDLSSPGKYAISVSRFVRSPRGKAKSNSLTVVIR